MKQWQTKCERAANWLESGLGSDCTFVVGAEQYVFRAHRMILVLASPVFETMLYENMAEKNTPIIISDIHHKIFKALLTFIYTEQLEISSVDEACDLCYAADKYRLPELKIKCREYLQNQLNSEDAGQLYDVIKTYLK